MRLWGNTFQKGRRIPEKGKTFPQVPFFRGGKLERFWRETGKNKKRGLLEPSRAEAPVRGKTKKRKASEGGKVVSDRVLFRPRGETSPAAGGATKRGEVQGKEDQF